MSIDTSQCQRVAGGFAGERATCPHHREGLSGSTECLGCATKWATGCKASWDGHLGRSLGIWVLGADGEDYRAVLLRDIHSEAAAQRRQLLLERQAASHPVLDLARRNHAQSPAPLQPRAPHAPLALERGRSSDRRVASGALSPLRAASAASAAASRSEMSTSGGERFAEVSAPSPCKEGDGV
jgi:hypothetical protein